MHNSFKLRQIPKTFYNNGTLNYSEMHNQVRKAAGITQTHCHLSHFVHASCSCAPVVRHLAATPLSSLRIYEVSRLKFYNLGKNPSSFSLSNRLMHYTFSLSQNTGVWLLSETKTGPHWYCSDAVQAGCFLVFWNKNGTKPLFFHTCQARHRI